MLSRPALRQTKARLGPTRRQKPNGDSFRDLSRGCSTTWCSNRRSRSSDSDLPDHTAEARERGVLQGPVRHPQRRAGEVREAARPARPRPPAPAISPDGQITSWKTRRSARSISSSRTLPAAGARVSPRERWRRVFWRWRRGRTGNRPNRSPHPKTNWKADTPAGYRAADQSTNAAQDKAIDSSTVCRIRKTCAARES